MDNESASATFLACRVDDFNVLPLGALISLAATNPWRQSSWEALPHPNRLVRVLLRDIGGRLV
jgi:hypothetical protein